jgi:hypothetical protein
LHGKSMRVGVNYLMSAARVEIGALRALKL